MSNYNTYNNCINILKIMKYALSVLCMDFITFNIYYKLSPAPALLAKNLAP